MNLSVQFVKYVVVAGVSAASDWLVFITMMMLFGQPIVAYGTARIIGAIVSFLSTSAGLSNRRTCARRRSKQAAFCCCSS